MGVSRTCATAPLVQTPSADRLATPTAAPSLGSSSSVVMYGAPSGRPTGISPSLSTAGKMKYEVYGTPSASTAIALPRPASSRNSVTNGTNRAPSPATTSPSGIDPHAAVTSAAAHTEISSRFDTSAGILASLGTPAANREERYGIDRSAGCSGSCGRSNTSARNRPVCESGSAAIASGAPTATIEPP